MSKTETTQLLLKIYKQLSPPKIKSSYSFPLKEVNHSNIKNISHLSFESTIYSGLATPMKFQQKHCVSPTLVEKIKEIVKYHNKSDREKVNELKMLLEIEVEEKKKFMGEEEEVGDELLEDDVKAEIIVIEDS